MQALYQRSPKEHTMWTWLTQVAPHHHDPLTVRRARVLAVVLGIFGAVAAMLTSFSLLDPAPQYWLPNAVACVVLVGLFVLNRRGHVWWAAQLFLAVNVLQTVVFMVLAQSPIPSVFFLTILVALAAALSGPRAAVIWAAGLSVLPWLINVTLFGTFLAPTNPIPLATGGTLPPLLVLEVLALGIMWLVTGASYLSSALLQQALDARSAETAQLRHAQQQLAAHQTELLQQNAALHHTRTRLEALVTALTVPVVPVATGVGFLPLIGPLDDERLLLIEQQTLHHAYQRRLRHLVIDLSGAQEVNPLSAEGLGRLCAALRLLGVDTVLAGLTAQAAQTLSQCNVMLPPTSATVESALHTLHHSTSAAYQKPQKRLVVGYDV